MQPSACLRDVMTFRLGGPCRRVISCETEPEARQAHGRLVASGEPYVWIGGGSNILVSDQGVDATVLRYVTDRTVLEIQDEGLECCAAIHLDTVCKWLAHQGWSGLNFCSGIPGTLGGGIVGNAGAWGREIGDSLDWVELLYPDGTVARMSADKLGFSYRHSELKEQAALVLRARIQIERGNPEELLAERRDILETRSAKHPNLAVDPCIGSFFRNIEPTSSAGRRQAAGWFLEQAGVGSLRVGGARVYEKHANILVAGEGCTAEDIWALSQKMKLAVHQAFGLNLEREVRLLGDFSGEKAPEHLFFH